MIFPVKADIIPLFHGVVASISPFAKANEVAIILEASPQEIKVEYRPDKLIHDLSLLISRVISFTPQKQQINLRWTCNNKEVHFEISNSGVNLAHFSEIHAGLYYAVIVKELSDKGTNFLLKVPNNPYSETTYPQQISASPASIRPYHYEIQKRLTSHFKNIRKLERLTYQKNQKQGVFLKKLNAIIQMNLDSEAFNIAELAKAMALSRTQLFRRVKMLTQMSPNKYLKTYRLQKARAMLESKTYNVSEVAYNVGFKSLSHFSRTFHEEYGFSPSVLTSRKSP
ncbi:MAG: helix-turn-helix transcriptional regulator [Saprospiraceae bacterium]|nr:helix-turn-helix transcriptional regulator [Saprospiraceae bacterium]